MKKIIILICIVIIISGCHRETQIKTEPIADKPILGLECDEDEDCDPILNRNLLFGFSYFTGCVNHSCVHNMDERCDEIAILDYDMANPTCAYQGDNHCGCKDTISPSKRRIRGRSIQIIPEEYGDTIWFYIVSY